MTSAVYYWRNSSYERASTSLLRYLCNGAIVEIAGAGWVNAMGSVGVWPSLALRSGFDSPTLVSEQDLATRYLRRADTPGASHWRRENSSVIVSALHAARGRRRDSGNQRSHKRMAVLARLYHRRPLRAEGEAEAAGKRSKNLPHCFLQVPRANRDRRRLLHQPSLLRVGFSRGPDHHRQQCAFRPLRVDLFLEPRNGT